MHVRRALLGILAVALLSGCRATHAPPVSLQSVPADEMPRAKSNLRVFDAVWSRIADDYYDRTLHGVDWVAAGQRYGPRAAAAADDDALYAVLNEMLGLLGDEHTRAHTAEQVADYEQRVSANIGVTIEDIDGRWAVVDVQRQSPAASAGVRPGWILVARNGAPLDDRHERPAREGQSDIWDFLDLSDRSQRLSIAPETLTTREEPVARVLPGGAVLIRFDEFGVAQQRWLNGAIEANQSAPALVLDLRGNSGGRLEVLVAVLGSFFDESVDCGRLFSRTGRRFERATRPCKTAHYSGPMAVLVDFETASAAEILSAVLQERRRATIVGRTTHGAVLGSLDFRLPDGGELQMSDVDYITPAGRRLEGEGVVPDVTVRLTLAGVRSGTDPDLEAALSVLGFGRKSR